MTDVLCDSPGFSEGVISVSDLRSWTSFLTETFEWSEVYRGKADSSLNTLWSLSSAVEIEEVLFRDPSAKTEQGGIRLLKFHGVTQVQARPNAYAWDTGGFFDLHVQVHDVQTLFEDMQRQGWLGYTEPQRLDVGGVVLNEVLIRGPDGMAFALIERVSPPFQIVENYRRVSPAWNAPQMVRDFTSVYDFYSSGLGFQPTIEMEMPPPADGENLFALPHSLAKQTKTQLAFFHPTGQRGAIGSVDLLHLPGVEGRNLGNRARPPNLGLLIMRFPVVDLVNYAAAITKNGVTIHAGPVVVDLSPYGRCNLFSVQSPEGAMLEFYEPFQ